MQERISERQKVIVKIMIFLPGILTTCGYKNPEFIKYLHIIYPPELEVRYSTDNSTSALYMGLFIQSDMNKKHATICFIKRDHSIQFAKLVQDIMIFLCKGHYLNQSC